MSSDKCPYGRETEEKMHLGKRGSCVIVETEVRVRWIQAKEYL